MNCGHEVARTVGQRSGGIPICGLHLRTTPSFKALVNPHYRTILVPKPRCQVTQARNSGCYGYSILTKKIFREFSNREKAASFWTLS